jgi:hypothetical protein
MTQYLLSVMQPAGPTPPAEVLAEMAGRLDALTDDLRKAGSWVFSGGLHEPGTATVVRVKDGETLLTDGPYAEGKEFLGGFTIVDVADLDAALDIAGRLAEITTLPIEVRPFQG